jgi:hypothetical protein
LNFISIIYILQEKNAEKSKYSCVSCHHLNY